MSLLAKLGGKTSRPVSIQVELTSEAAARRCDTNSGKDGVNIKLHGDKSNLCFIVYENCFLLRRGIYGVQVHKPVWVCELRGVRKKLSSKEREMIDDLGASHPLSN